MDDLKFQIPRDAYPGSGSYSSVKNIFRLKDDFYVHTDRSWVPLGQTVEIAGKRIPGGVYVGDKLPTLHAKNEPSLVDPAISVACRDAAPVDPDEATEPYRALDPSARAAYLDWLASGRDGGEATAAQLELYLWGIERRILVDSYGSVSAKRELPELVHELMRISDALMDAGLSERKRSLGYWVCEMINLAAIRELEKRVSVATPPAFTTSRFAELEFRLGLMAVAGKVGRLNADWALAWYRRSGVLKPRKNAERFEREFDELFRTRFNTEFENGVPISTESYRFGLWVNVRNPGIPGPLKYFTRYRQILIREVSIPIRTLVDECESDLEAYGKYVGASPGRADSLRAAALLPDELFEVSDLPGLERLREFALGVSAEARGYSIDELFGIPRDPAVRPGDEGDLASISVILGRLGVGIEPDPIFGGQMPTGLERLYLFTSATQSERAPDEAFRFADNYLVLAAGVVRRNAALDDTALGTLRQVVDSLGLSTTAHADRLKARLSAYRDFPPTTHEVKVRARRLAKQGHARIPEQLLQIGRLNGSLGPEGISLLTQIFEIFGLPVETVFRQVHALETERIGHENLAELMHPSSDPGEPSALLDRDELARKRADTEHANSLLDGIYKSDEDLDLPNAIGKSVPTTGGLVRFFSELGEQHQYSATEVYALAERCGVLGAAALEEINEAAFELVDEPVWEEHGDGYIVHLDVHVRMSETKPWALGS